WHSGLLQKPASLRESDRRDADRQVLIRCRTADCADEVQLPAHLVAADGLWFRFRHPVRQQLIRILTAVGQAEGDVRQVGYKGRGKGALAVDGEDHGAVETGLRQAGDNFGVAGLAPGARRLHPGGIVDDDVVYLGYE